MIQLGLIGAGAWGKRYAETIARRNDLALVGVARASAQGGEQVFGVPVTRDWRELLALDGVIVATTPDNQAEVVAAAIERGTPTLAEKPLGLSHEVSAQLHASWQAAPQRAPVLVNYVHLWAAAFVELQRLLRERGGAPSVKSVIAQGSSSGPFRQWPTLYDYGSHDGAMLLRLFEGAPIHVENARRLEAGARGELFEFALRAGAAAVTLTLGNGAATKTRKFILQLTDGSTLAYDDLRAHPDKLTLNGSAILIDTTPPLDSVVADFASRIDHWQRTGTLDERAEGGLALCRDVSALLDQLALHCQ